MDPVTVRFIQIIAAQIFGAGLAIAGLWLFFRGASGRMNLLLQGMGMKARLTNATPGGLVFLLGCVTVIVAMMLPTVERTTRTA